jgi:hypothetical protein
MNRHQAAAIMLVASPIFYVSSLFAWPAGSDADTSTSLRTAAAHPAMWTLAVVLEALSWTVLIPGVVCLFGFLRARGRTLGLLGAVAVVAGTLAAWVDATVNLANLALARELDLGTGSRVADAITGQPAFIAVLAMFFLGPIGFVLLGLGALRGRIVRRPVPVLLAAGLVLGIVGTSATAPLSVLLYVPTGVGLALLGISLFTVRIQASPQDDLDGRTDVECDASVADLASAHKESASAWMSDSA